MLFTAYNNDLPSIPQHWSTDCYVDDTKLLMSFQVQACEPTMAAMNDDLIKLRNWCFNNRLLLNPDKTKLIVYGSRQMISKLQDFRLTLLGKELLPVDSVKDLSVVFDSKLSFNDHTIKLYCIVLYCIALHCIALHCIALYCIVLYCIVSPRKREVMVGVKGKAAKLNKSFYEIEIFYFDINKAKDKVKISMVPRTKK